MSFIPFSVPADLLPPRNAGALRPRMQTMMFVVALTLYAFWGVPTPDHVGIFEYAVLILLFGGVCWDDLVRVRTEILYIAGGLCVPLLVGALYGHAVGDMLRDAVAYLILFLPLFYARHARQLGPIYFGLLALIGVAFSLRALISYGGGLWDIQTWISGAPPDTQYLANSPEVLFTALYGIGYAIERFVRAKYGATALYILLSFSPILAMTIMMQRAGLALCAVGATGMLIWAMWMRPARALIMLVGVVALFAGVYVIEPRIFEALLTKNQMTGWNGRDREWAAVVDIVFQDMGHSFFGLGWGGRFENPAVAGLEVNFTHSLFSSILLKSGIIGVFLLGAAGLFFVKGLQERRFAVSPLVCALVFPLILGLFLYASYKSLGFGLLILGLSAYFSGEISPNASKKLEKPEQAVP